MQRHMTQAYHPGLLAEQQDLNKQVFQRNEIAAPEFTDAAVIQRLVASEDPKGQILSTGSLDLREETMPTQ
jgi:hypothetical protein